MRGKTLIIVSALLVVASGCGKVGGAENSASLNSLTTSHVTTTSNAPTGGKGNTISTDVQNNSSKPPSPTDWIAVKLNHDELTQEQDGEKDGHRVSLLLPDMVARDFVFHTPDLNAFTKGKLSDQQFAKDSILELSIDQETLWLHLVQPIQKGKQGIWTVDKYQIVK